MNKYLKAYYRLTAYLPRLLPNTEETFLELKFILTEAFGVQDRPDAWICVVSHIQNTPAHKLRKPWGHIANAAKRLRVNNIAQAYRQKIQKELEDQFNASVAKFAADEAAKQELEVPIAPV